MKNKTVFERLTPKEKAALKKIDPSYDFWAAVGWQDPDNFATLAITVTEHADLFPEIEAYAVKPSDTNFRDIQKLCWVQYRTFGPLNASVNSKADYVAQSGFSVYSDIYEIDLFLKDLFYSYRNKLYARIVGWVIRMLAEGELFLLLALDDTGSITVRILEPSKIGSENEKGLLVDPDDASQTLFYQYKTTDIEEYIPDARFLVEPDYMKEREKALGETLKKELINKITKSKNGKTGGYRRFVLHWKNLTGIYEYLRDTSSLSTVIEWIKLYVKSLKWGLDHKRAQSAYTWGIKFDDGPAGKVAWHIWQKMTQAEKDATGLTKPLTPGSRIFLMPGMSLAVYNPNIRQLSGDNQDVLNLSGAGARTPQDLWQGQTAGSTYASVKSTRPPLVAEIENLQSKLGHFLKYEFLRVCLAAKIAHGGSLLTASGKKMKLPETYKETIVTEIVNGVATKTKKVDSELCEAVKFTFPKVQLADTPQDTANAALGSKHAGLHSIGVSSDTIARMFGVDDLSRERRKKMLEDTEISPPIAPDQPGLPTKQNVKGVEGDAGSE